MRRNGGKRERCKRYGGEQRRSKTAGLHKALETVRLSLPKILDRFQDSR
jgi:hypothetical protein